MIIRSILAALLVGSIGASPVPAPSIGDKTNALAEQWKQRLREEHLNYVVAAPYVIAGDATAAQLGRYRDGTILAATRSLEATFFSRRPTQPIIILLFSSEVPYKRLSKKWLNDDDVPHYGFYRPGDRVMVMNVSTGLGTLVHELTHALIAPDFPKVPDWFNEGLASLYEQSTLGDKTITGHENWRLPALQSAIRSRRLRPLQELLDDPHFYRSDLVGLNYAQARYLMFYLQQKRLLVRYYKLCRDSVEEDPTGQKSLEKLIAPQSLADFEKDWRKWVLTLKF